ncbi:MAG: hypothetical protein NZL88_07550 [Gaiellaceae bacterium]|nr:hypothetical protein [Gaiellaceae bacterium]
MDLGVVERRLLTVEPIWQRQPWESDQGYRAFCLYRDLPPHERSVARVARLVRRSPGYLQRVASRDRWVERARAYLVHLERIVLQEHEQAIRRYRREATERALQVGSTMVEIGATRLRGGTLAGHEVAALDPNRLDAEAAVRMVVEGDRLVRLALGLPTNLRESFTVSAADFATIVSGIVDLARGYMTEEEHDAYVLDCEAMVCEILGAPGKR